MMKQMTSSNVFLEPGKLERDGKHEPMAYRYVNWPLHRGAAFALGEKVARSWIRPMIIVPVSRGLIAVHQYTPCNYDENWICLAIVMDAQRGSLRSSSPEDRRLVSLLRCSVNYKFALRRTGLFLSRTTPRKEREVPFAMICAGPSKIVHLFIKGVADRINVLVLQD